MEKATRYLRPRKAQRYVEIVRDYRDLTGQLRIDEYDDVVVSPMGQIEGASEKPEPGLIIDDCDFCARMSTSGGGNPLRISGRVLYGGYFRSQWGHFLMNSTSRLWPLFTGAADGVDHILFFSDTGKDFVPGGNYREFLKLAGIAEKVIIVSTPVITRHLIVPEIAFEQFRHFSREAMAIYDAIRSAALAGAEAENAEKILLTRSSLPTAAKDEINIDKIDDLFSRNGYKIVSPENLSLSRLIRMMNSARSIASLSGSTAHNLVFAPREAELIIVERTAVNNIFQIAISLMAGHDHTLIDAFRLPRIAPSTGRLFLYGATGPLERFIADRGWAPHTFDDSARRRELRRFLTRHLRQSGHATGIEGWEIDDMKAIAEAYLDSHEYYRPWLDRRRPLLLSDYFSPRCLLRLLRHRQDLCR